MPIGNPKTLALALAVFSGALACRGGAEAGKGVQEEEKGTSDLAGSAGLPDGAQAISFLGEPLFPPELPPEVRGLVSGELPDYTELVLDSIL